MDNQLIQPYFGSDFTMLHLIDNGAATYTELVWYIHMTYNKDRDEAKEIASYWMREYTKCGE